MDGPPHHGCPTAPVRRPIQSSTPTGDKQYIEQYMDTRYIDSTVIRQIQQDSLAGSVCCSNLPQTIDTGQTGMQTSIAAQNITQPSGTAPGQLLQTSGTLSLITVDRDTWRLSFGVVRRSHHHRLAAKLVAQTSANGAVRCFVPRTVLSGVQRPARPTAQAVPVGSSRGPYRACTPVPSSCVASAALAPPPPVGPCAHS